MGSLFNWIKRLVTGSTGAKKSKIRVLAVGVENSPRYGACPGATVDARRMHDRIGAGKKVLILNNDARKATVLSALRDGVAGTDEDGLFVFFFSGHGGQRPSKDPSETDGRDETLCAYDAEIVDDEVWNVISKARCRVFMITDSCSSGTNYRGVKPEKFWRRVVGMGSGGPRLLHWGGCSDGQYSYGGSSGGILTNAILDILDKDYSYAQAFRKVVSRVKSSEVPTRYATNFDEDVELFR